MNDDLRKRMVIVEYRRPKDAAMSKQWRIADATLGILMSSTGEMISFSKRRIIRY